MRTKSCLAPVVLLLLAPGLAAAIPLGVQQASSLKISVIDSERVMSESNVARSLTEQAQEAAQEWQTRIEAKRQELDQLVRQRQEQALTLSEAALARINAEDEQAQVELQRLQEDANRQMQRLEATYQSQLGAVLMPALERLAEEDGYDLILDTRTQGLLYHSDTIDVTDKLIEILNVGSGAVAGSAQQNRQQPQLGQNQSRQD